MQCKLVNECSVKYYDLVFDTFDKSSVILFLVTIFALDFTVPFFYGRQMYCIPVYHNISHVTCKCAQGRDLWKKSVCCVAGADRKKI